MLFTETVHADIQMNNIYYDMFRSHNTKLQLCCIIYIWSAAAPAPVSGETPLLAVPVTVGQPRLSLQSPVAGLQPSLGVVQAQPD